MFGVQMQRLLNLRVCKFIWHQILNSHFDSLNGAGTLKDHVLPYHCLGSCGHKVVGASHSGNP